MIVQMIYFSRNLGFENQAGLTNMAGAILADTRQNNLRDDITGYLLVDRNWFIQVLEGIPEKIDETFSRIQKDRRHTAISVIQYRTIQTRSFQDWSMGCSLKTLDKYPVFMRQNIGALLDPRALTADEILALTFDLSKSDASFQPKYLFKADPHQALHALQIAGSGRLA